jgi:hypothetical protein
VWLCPIRVGRDCPIVRSGGRRVWRLTERPRLLLMRPAGRSKAAHHWKMRADPPTIGRVRISAKAAMTIEDIAAAVQRVESVLKRRPATGIHDDAPATARWQTGLRVVARAMPTARRCDRHADRTRRQWRSGHAGLAVSCGSRVLPRDAHRDGGRERRDRTYIARGAG